MVVRMNGGREDDTALRPLKKRSSWTEGKMSLKVEVESTQRNLD